MRVGENSSLVIVQGFQLSNISYHLRKHSFLLSDSYNKWCRSQVDFSFLKDGEEGNIFETIIELICMPIMMMMNILPSVEEEDSAPDNAWDRNKYMITFVGSIGFIGFFSYFMVWWAEIIGCTIGIPSTSISST